MQITGCCVVDKTVRMCDKLLQKRMRRINSKIKPHLLSLSAFIAPAIVNWGGLALVIII